MSTPTMAGDRPQALPVLPDNIPAVLKACPQWLVWRYVSDVDAETGEIDWDKPPLNARTGGLASSTNSATWSDCETALAAYRRGGLDGIGYVLHRGAGEDGQILVAIDLDDCRNPETGEIEEWARLIIKALNSYTELSPSGRGIRIFVLAKLPPSGRKKGRFECYETARYVTVTGQHLQGAPREIEPRQDELAKVHKRIFGAAAEAKAVHTGGGIPASADDAEIVRRATEAKNGPKFSRLWGGDAGDYRSASEADLGLCNHLAFWVGSNEQRIADLFAQSGLFRSKWNREDYRKRTIAKALSGRGPNDFYDWHEGKANPNGTPGEGAQQQDAGECTLGELLDRHQELRQPVIHGLLREGETANIIALSKIGKSWLALDKVLAVATGGLWLGTFKAEQGQVLVIDNELHPETLAYRIRKVAEARRIDLNPLRDRITIKCLRGQLRDILALRTYFDGIEPGRYKLVVLDTLYRMLPRDASENDNAAMAGVYNAIDGYARKLGCCFATIHHASKGNQADKSVTDVGAGAGSMSRAADSHLILRPHQEDGVYVLEAAVRSWPPVEPRCLRWQYPVWQPEDGLSPEQLRRPEEKRRQAEKAIRTSNDDVRLLTKLDELDPGRAGYGVNKIGLELGWDYRRINGAITRLESHELLERCRVKVDIGSKTKREVDGIRRPSVQGATIRATYGRQ